MISRKDGVINDIVYRYTVYNNGENRYYPTINDLAFLIEKIVRSNATTEYIRFNPFYINYKLDRQVEFDEYMFYLECREHFTESDLKHHLSECVGKHFDEMSQEEKRRANILFPLCKNDDSEKFGEALLSFKSYLNELMPLLFCKVKEEIHLTSNNMAFGFFCFEVHSN